jgi:hypothetical protein
MLAVLYHRPYNRQFSAGDAIRRAASRSSCNSAGISAPSAVSCSMAPSPIGGHCLGPERVPPIRARAVHGGWNCRDTLGSPVEEWSPALVVGALGTVKAWASGLFAAFRWTNRGSTEHLADSSIRFASGRIALQRADYQARAEHEAPVFLPFVTTYRKFCGNPWRTELSPSAARRVA